ncbi:hypothetical protein EDD27_6022 [Nonomuraea polychroma]|uniref:Uncharacterized protein n=1 Tax=Nonomuraea polychroma TaxID=46176 RepID=A0A438MCR4_9ACTN|nr:hypothetical protein EDD27_6022 [Nonomuraea polychroma]
MAYRSHIYHPGKPGIWPNGEPQSVRDAYDVMLTQQAQETDSDSQPTAGESR